MIRFSRKSRVQPHRTNHRLHLPQHHTSYNGGIHRIDGNGEDGGKAMVQRINKVLTDLLPRVEVFSFHLRILHCQNEKRKFSFTSLSVHRSLSVHSHAPSFLKNQGGGRSRKRRSRSISLVPLALRRLSRWR